MKSITRCFQPTVLFILMVSVINLVKAQPNGQPEDPKEIVKIIFHMDSLFWEAYNVCDVEKMATFFTDDLEFYHDKGGLTTPKKDFIESLKTGLCGNPNWRLRREAIVSTVKVFPLNNIGGLISGEHVFYINETGKKEFLDGYGKFTQVWRYKDNAWKMSRVLSYDHGPAPYRNVRKEIALSPALLKKYAGKYESAKAGVLTITPEGTTLKMEASKFQSTLYAESESMFFLKERDLRFEFVKENKKVVKMIVHENGKITEEAMRMN